MSAAMTSERRENPAVQTNNPPSASILRVWPVVLMLAAFWAFEFAAYGLQMSMFARFMSRFAAYGVLLLFFLGWWLTRRAIRWRDRLLAIAVVVLAGVAAYSLVDPSINVFGLLMGAFPLVITAWILWLVIARRLSPVVQRAGFCAVILLVFGYFTLLRFDGLYAGQAGEMNWRWQPTSEQVFLAGHAGGSNGAAADETPAAASWQPQPGDWLEFRGPRRDGVLTGVRLGGDWNEQPPKLLWRERVGPGWSGMIVVDGHLVTQEQRGDAEVVVCRDAATGKETWVHEDAVRFEESLSGAGPRGTPTFADGRIFTLGGKGTLNCLKAPTGEVVWTHDIVADAGVSAGEIPIWGYSGSPLVVDGMVIVFAGGTAGKSVLAYRAEDGELAWSRPAGKHAYSSPQLVTLGGTPQVLMHDNSGLHAWNAADGELLWEYAIGNENSFPMLQPHLGESSNDLVISTEPGAALLRVDHDADKWTVTPRWTTPKFRPGFNDFVIHQGCLYGVDDGVLVCLDLETGKRLWKKGRTGFGQPVLLADQDAVLIALETGEVILASVSRDGYQELGRFQAIEGKTWNGPVLAGGRLFLRNGEEMAGYEVVPSNSSLPAAAQ